MREPLLFVPGAGWLGLPAVEEGVEGVWGGMFELLLSFGVEEVTAGVKDGEGGDAVLDGGVEAGGDVGIVVHVADVDVDGEVARREEGGVLRLLLHEVEDDAIRAPVAAELEQDVFVLAGGAGDGDLDVLLGVGVGWVEVAVYDGLLGESSCREEGEGGEAETGHKLSLVGRWMGRWVLVGASLRLVRRGLTCRFRIPRGAMELPCVGHPGRCGASGEMRGSLRCGATVWRLRSR